MTTDEEWTPWMQSESIRGDRTERIQRRCRVAVRALSIFCIVLWLTFPVSIAAWIWTGDWRWLVSGVLAFLSGFAIGIGLRDAVKRIKAIDP